MSAAFSTYCLGVGCMDRCNTCQHEKNWHTLNQLPNALRLAQQRQMKRMDQCYCQITSGLLYVPAGQPPGAMELEQ